MMGSLQRRVSRVSGVVFLLGCTGVGNDGSLAGSSGTRSGAATAGAGGQATSNVGGTTSPGNAGAMSGGRSGSGGASAAGVTNGGNFTSGGASMGGAGARSDANGGGVGSPGGAGGRRGGFAGAPGFGGIPGFAGASGMPGSAVAGAPSAGTSSAGAAGACVQDLSCMPTAAPLSSDIHQDCVDRINQFRTQCGCLPPLARWTDGEACADQMAEYDAMQDSAHAGFEAHICSSGQGGQNECPAYASDSQVISLCIQQMWSEGPGPENPCNGQCFEDHGHFINMTSTSMTKVACGFYTTSSGKVWAAQNFSN